MKKITEILKEKKFTISLEIVPPRNGNPTDITYNDLKKLKGKIDFLSVTKGAGGSLRGGTLPISYFAWQKFGITPVSHFVCRERTKQEIENELIDLYYFGINNILALRGDPPAGSKEEWNGDYKHAYLLVKQLKNLNEGKYLPRESFEKDFREGLKTDFCILVAGHPEDPPEQEAKHIQAKLEAGAEVIITQMIFSFKEYKDYVENLKKHGIKLPVIPGIRPLTNLKQAESVENFFKLKVADELKEGLKNAKDEKEAYEFGINYTAEMIKELKKYGAPGAHLFVLNDIKLVEEILENCRI